jgi:hypothetical protein
MKLALLILSIAPDIVVIRDRLLTMQELKCPQFDSSLFLGQGCTSTMYLSGLYAIYVKFGPFNYNVM